MEFEPDNTSQEDIQQFESIAASLMSRLDGLTDDAEQGVARACLQMQTAQQLLLLAVSTKCAT